MLGWLYLIVSGAAVGLLWGEGPRPAFYLSLAVFAASFWTFCVLYDAPLNRAKSRITHRLSQLSTGGIHTEEVQRLQSMSAKATDEDKRFRLTFLSGVNIATGILGTGLLIWAVLARVM